MDLEIYLLLLVLLCLKDGETGGHGEKHHDHVKVYVPEFIHHDHHTKVITIHHHHHKPKKEHHHHHHHHPKPHIPMGHHYHHHHKKAHTVTTKTSKGHHGHHSHHGHHGHHGHHHHGHHHDPVPYDPPVPPSYEDYGSYSPPIYSHSPQAPAYEGGISASVPHSPSVTAFDGGHSAPVIPQVRGITHTIKQVKVFDSHPGAIPNVGTGGNHGYEVTEQGDEGEDVFTSVNSVQQNFPGTYGYIQGVAEQPTHDPFGELTPQGAVQTNNHDPFAGAIAQPTVSLTGGETFAGIVQNDPFSSVAPSPSGIPSVQPAQEFPASFQGDAGFDEHSTSFLGDDGGNTAFLSEGGIESDTPVTFHREAGVQQTVQTGGHETVVY